MLAFQHWKGESMMLHKRFLICMVTVLLMAFGVRSVVAGAQPGQNVAQAQATASVTTTPAPKPSVTATSVLRLTPTAASQYVNAIAAVAFAPDNTKIVVGHSDGVVRVWDIATGQELRVYREDSVPIVSVSFSPDGTLVLVGSNDGFARLYDIRTSEKKYVVDARRGGKLWSCVFAPDGQHILTGGDDSVARLWTLGSADDPLAFRAGRGAMLAVAISPDAKLVAAATIDGNVLLWEKGADDQIAADATVFDGLSGGPLRSIAFSADSSLVVTGSDYPRLWATDGTIKMTLRAPNKFVTGAAISPNGKYVAAGGTYTATAMLWDVGGNPSQPLRTFLGHTEKVTSVAFSPNGLYLLTGSLDRTTRLWDVATGKELRRFP